MISDTILWPMYLCPLNSLLYLERQSCPCKTRQGLLGRRSSHSLRLSHSIQMPVLDYSASHGNFSLGFRISLFFPPAHIVSPSPQPFSFLLVNFSLFFSHIKSLGPPAKNYHKMRNNPARAF